MGNREREVEMNQGVCVSISVHHHGVIDRRILHSVLCYWRYICCPSPIDDGVVPQVW